MSNQSCFNVKLWTVDQVLLWIKGLGEFIKQHAEYFEQNKIDGCRLLILTNCDLIDMGINKLQDQEVILQGINLLQYMTFEMSNETLKTCASKLEVACLNLVCRIKRISTQPQTQAGDSRNALKSRLDICRLIENTLKCIFSMLSWINRLESYGHANWEEEKQSLILCSHILFNFSEKDVPVSILTSACDQLMGMCLEVIQNPNNLLNSQPCSLEVIQIQKQGDQKLGLEIRCSLNGIPYISSIEENSLSAASGGFEVKDEIIQIKEQTVLGWDVKVLKQFIDSSKDKVKFTIKRRPELSYASSKNNRNDKKELVQGVAFSKRGIRSSSSEGNLLSYLEELSRKSSQVPPLSEDRPCQIPSPWLPRDGRSSCNDLDGSEASLSGLRGIPPKIQPKFILKKTKKFLCSSFELLLNNERLPQSPNFLRKFKLNKMNRRMSCQDLGGTDCKGWVWMKQEIKGGSVFNNLEKWGIYWVVLRSRIVQFYKDPMDDRSLRCFSLMKCKFSPDISPYKFSFKVWDDDDTFVIASDRKEDMLKWMNKMALASLEDLNAEDLHAIGGFQTYHKKSIQEFDEETSNNQGDEDIERDETEEGLKRWYNEIQRADVGLDGRNEKARRSTILTSSRSLKGDKSNMNILKLLSLNRMLKDKQQKFEAIENFLDQLPITPVLLKEFLHHNPSCILDAAYDLKIVESDV